MIHQLAYNQPMEIVDSHCHIDVAAFDADRDQVLADCHGVGVTRLVVPAVAAAGWDKLLGVCRGNAGLYPALGLHPVYVDQHRQQDLDALASRINSEPDVVAVGEIGLDFFLAELDRQRQLDLFDAQLQIAKSANLPVILHVRKAHAQVIELLKKCRVRGGVVHAFNGSLEQAKEYIGLGFKLGFGGMLSYERSRKLHLLAKALPLDAMVLETDAPDMPGAGHAGQRNSPQFLLEYLTALAELRQENIEHVAEVTTQNAIAVLGLN